MRKPVPPEIGEEVLLLCRRRCCLCYGLNNDLTIKQGQIAHLDRDASNNEIENFAFFCLSHHDQYDTMTSQTKRLTEGEVKHFRQKLHDLIARDPDSLLSATPSRNGIDPEIPVADQSKTTEKYNNSDKLAIALACLAGVMAIILFLVEKTPWVVGGLLPLMIGLCIYPIVHFAKSRFLRSTLLVVAVLATAVFGWMEWPNAKVVSHNSGTSSAGDSKSEQGQNTISSAVGSPAAQEKDKPAKPKKYHPKPAPAVPSSSDASSHTPASPASSQTQPLSQVCEPGASCAASTGQQGGITAGTYIAGPPPPIFKLETINKNSEEGPESFRTEYRLDVTTTTPLSLYVRAQAPDIGSKMRMQPCLEVLRLRNGFASGNMRDVVSGAGFCEGHASDVTSGSYQIVVFTTKAEDVQLTYQPD